jgi:hypothetical protein
LVRRGGGVQPEPAAHQRGEKVRRHGSFERREQSLRSRDEISSEECRRDGAFGRAKRTGTSIGWKDLGATEGIPGRALGGFAEAGFRTLVATAAVASEPDALLQT